MSEDNPTCEQCGKEIMEEDYFTDDHGVNFHNNDKCLAWLNEDDKDMFKIELTKLINKHGLESTSDTPDFILADYLIQCLAVFNVAYKERKRWYE